MKDPSLILWGRGKRGEVKALGDGIEWKKDKQYLGLGNLTLDLSHVPNSCMYSSNKRLSCWWLHLRRECE